MERSLRLYSIAEGLRNSCFGRNGCVLVKSHILCRLGHRFPSGIKCHNFDVRFVYLLQDMGIRRNFFWLNDMLVKSESKFNFSFNALWTHPFRIIGHSKIRYRWRPVEALVILVIPCFFLDLFVLFGFSFCFLGCLSIAIFGSSGVPLLWSSDRKPVSAWPSHSRKEGFKSKNNTWWV